MAPLVPHHPKFRVLSIHFPTLHHGSPDTCSILNAKEGSNFDELICWLPVYFFLSSILDTSKSFHVCFADFLSLRCIPCSLFTLCHLKDKVCRRLHEPMGNVYKGDRRQGEAKVFPWPLYSLGDVSGSCWHFPTVPAHTWQLRLPPDAPELISLPQCVDLGDPAACFPDNVEAVPPSSSAFMSITSLAVIDSLN